MDLFVLLFFAFAVSLDALGAGFAYGLREIKIPFVSYLFVGFTSVVVVAIFIICGHIAGRSLPVIWAKRVGGLLLFGIGLWWYLRGKKEKTVGKNLGEPLAKVFKFKLATFAVIIQILEEPIYADFDASGTISIQESLLLGLALSVDAVGAGFGVALAGINCLIVICMVVFYQQLFLFLGTRLARCSYISWFEAKGPLLASMVLCLLGLLRFLQVA